MADPKRSSTGAKPTPPAKGGLSELDATIQKATNAKVRVHTSSSSAAGGHTIEGVLLSPDASAAALVVDSNPSAPTREIHFVAIANISEIEIVSLHEAKKEKSGGEEAAGNGIASTVPKPDIAAARAREEAAIRQMKERDAQRGKGVTKEAQDIFDWFIRTLPTRWADQTIVVSDSVLVEPPYKMENIKGPKDRQPAVAQIKKVLEGYYQKKRGASGASTPQPTVQGKPAPAVPVQPRKGG